MFSSTALLTLAVVLFAIAGVIFFLKNKITLNTSVYANSDLDLLIKEIEIYLTNTYPHIVFDYQKIEKIKNDQQILTKDILIIEEIVTQFATFECTFTPKKYVNKEQLWNGYEALSVPLKDKLPKDFMKRKELALQMYHRQCARCGQKIDMNDSMTYLIKKLENGGSYRFENIAVLCSDCNKILTSNNDISKTIASLHIHDYLIQKINH